MWCQVGLLGVTWECHHEETGTEHAWESTSQRLQLRVSRPRLEERVHIHVSTRMCARQLAVSPSPGPREGWRMGAAGTLVPRDKKIYSSEKKLILTNDELGE